MVWPLLFLIQELQKALDKRKAIVLSVNLCSAEFVQCDSEESREMRARLTDMNNHWDKLGRALEAWRASLQDALMQCQVGVLLAAEERPIETVTGMCRRVLLCALYRCVDGFASCVSRSSPFSFNELS